MPHEDARLDHNAEIAAAPSNRRSRSRSVAWLSPLDGAARDDRMPAVMLVSVARYLPHHSSPRIENRVRLTMCGRVSFRTRSICRSGTPISERWG